MCEQPPYWLWLRENLILWGKGLLGFLMCFAKDVTHYPRKLLKFVTAPVFQIILGMFCIWISFVYAIFMENVAFVILIVPSFLLTTHGIYRDDDC